jgi:hypothetical protein
MALLHPLGTRQKHVISAAGLVLVGTLLACGASAPPDATPASAPSPAAPEATSAASAAPDSTPPPVTAAPAPPAEPTPDKTASEKGPPPGQATVDKTPLTGKISQQTIMDLVMKNQELFNDCYTIGAGKSKQFVATVTVKASIGPTGAVNTSQISKSTAKNPKVDKCVADAFKKMQFPATGSTVPITFPMEFNGAEQVK